MAEEGGVRYRSKRDWSEFPPTPRGRRHGGKWTQGREEEQRRQESFPGRSTYIFAIDLSQRYRENQRYAVNVLLIVPFLTISPTNSVTSAVSNPDQGVPHPDKGGPNSTDEKKPDWKSAASATAKLFLRGVRDAADAFGPLKSIAGGLCFILENCEV